MKQFDKGYFKRYRIKNIFGAESGSRPFLYSFWMRKLKKFIAKNGKVLDAGCGQGYFLRRLEKRYKTIGFDISEDALLSAKNRTKKSTYIKSLAERLPFQNNSFSVVIAFDIIEHLEQPDKFLREAYGVLVQNGFLIISTPNPESFGCKIKLKMPEWKGLNYEKRIAEWYGWRDDTHLNIKLRSEWKKILQKTGFRIIKDGTDTLWDVPYFKRFPYILQKIFFISLHWLLIMIFGFFPWKYGENYICIAKKV